MTPLIRLAVSATHHHVARRRRLADLRVDVAQLPAAIVVVVVASSSVVVVWR